MTEKIKRQWHRMSLTGRVAIISLLAILGVFQVLAVDSDNDGMSDTYELFYGLNPNSSVDASFNNDSDGLDNLAESTVLTDPFASDTDRDGWEDGVDSNPVSRAYIKWGDPFFTSEDVYSYAAPVWLLNAEKVGGEWVTNALSCWHVDAEETNSANLLIYLDNMFLTNDVVVRLSIFDHTYATLYADLYDDSFEVIAANIEGNISLGSDAPASVLLNVPISAYSNAAAISIRREAGEATVYSMLIYVDQDGDGLDLEQELQLETSDHDVDSDDDGLSDYDEVFIYGTNPSVADTDNDGLSDYAEINTHSTNPSNPDSDNDGLTDGAEINTHGTNPNNSDSDGDQMNDGWEVQYGLDPMSGGAVAAYWTLDESSGTIAIDSSTNLNDGTVFGADHVSGVISNALQFDGSNDLVTVANSATYKPSTLTVSCFVRFDSLFGNTVSGSAADGRMVLVAQANAGGGYGYALYKSALNSLVFEIANSSETNVTLVESMAPFVTTGTWINIAGTYDGTNACLYVDGKLLASKAHNSVLEYDFSTGLSIGNNPSGMDDSFFAGTLDNIRILHGAMSAAEIAEPYGDPDGDGLNNIQESQFYSNPSTSDTDGDGLSDDSEINIYGTDPADSDTDNDGMPDGWEVVNGLNPLSAGDASLDADGDGISNLQEYQYGTSPNNADSDSDGMTDKWERDHGFNPLSATDGSLDTDNDGLRNVEEFRAGSDPRIVDTDGDGMNDWMEVMKTYTDPQASDFFGADITTVVLKGSTANESVGKWMRSGDEVVSYCIRGYIGFTNQVNIAEPNVYRLDLECYGVWMSRAKIYAFVDGVYVGAAVLNSSGGVTNRLCFFTQWLTGGVHNVGFYYDNLFEQPELHVKSVKFIQLEGSDSNGNGRADWVDSRISKMCSAGAVSESKVSPYCIEGIGFFPELMNISGDLRINEGPANTWYANIPLDESNPVTSVVRFQNNAVAFTNQIAWKEFNVLSESDITIRKNDSLLLGAHTSEATNITMEVRVSGSTNMTAEIGSPIPFMFTAASNYLVTGLCTVQGTTYSNSVFVRVVSAEFPTNGPGAWVGKTRSVSCPDISTNANIVIQRDTATTISKLQSSGNGSSMNISVQDADSRHWVVARIYDQGPIISNMKIDAFNVYSTVDGYYRYVETLSDGSKVIENTVTTWMLPDDVELRLSIFKSGVTFTDGSTQMTIRRSDLNPSGSVSYRMIMPASVNAPCHYIKAYESGQLIH